MAPSLGASLSSNHELVFLGSGQASAFRRLPVVNLLILLVIVAIALHLSSQRCSMPAVIEHQSQENDFSPAPHSLPQEIAIAPSLSGISVVTTLKEFHPRSSNCSQTLQVVAFQSWLRFADEVIVLVDKAETCSRLLSSFPKVVCKPHACSHFYFGIPIVSCLLIMGEALARSSTVFFTNPDLVYSDVRPTVGAGARLKAPYLLVGQRTDVKPALVCEQLGDGKATNLSHSTFISLLRTNGTLQPGYALDYFIFSKGSLALAAMPPFLVGVWRWDNWLLAATIKGNRTRVIDATPTIAAMHIGTEMDTGRYSVSKGAAYNGGMFDANLPFIGLELGAAGAGEIRFTRWRMVQVGNTVEVQHR